MPRLKRIDRPKQLIVEGQDTLNFFEALLREIGLAEEIQVQNFGGVSELGNFLGGFLNAIKIAPGSEDSLFFRMESIGIVRDAEAGDPNSAFQSVCGALKSAGLNVPGSMEAFEGEEPRVGVLILPDAESSGMLETLCLRSVSDDPVMECIDHYFRCVEKQKGELPRNMYKARVQAFIASKPYYASDFGVAVKKSYFPWDNEAFDHIKAFLREL